MGIISFLRRIEALPQEPALRAVARAYISVLPRNVPWKRAGENTVHIHACIYILYIMVFV